MDRSLRSSLSLALLAALSLTATQAVAQSKDAQAKKLEAQAMDEDYLATNFAGAEAKIQQAIKTTTPPTPCRTSRPMPHRSWHCRACCNNSNTTISLPPSSGRTLR